MKNILTVSLIILFNYLATFSQEQLKPNNNFIIYNFGTRTAESTYDTVVSFTNSNNYAITITNYKFLTSYFPEDFSANIDLPATVPAESVIEIPVRFRTAHNIARTSICVFYYTNGASPAIHAYPVVLEARSIYPESQYAQTYGQWGADLVSTLRGYVSGHTSFTYKQARTYMFSDCDNIEGYVECIYTGRKIKTNTIPSTDFDTEHLWPQSLGAENEPPRSDLHHLRPTYKDANNTRSSFPFGIVVSGQDWEDGGSKRGKDKFGNTVFEPRDVSKGNVARGILYFGLRYSNPTSFINSQETMLHAWNLEDRPDSLERRRNDRVESYQKRRNPFVDHPEFAERLSISDENLKKPQYSLIDRDTVRFSENSNERACIINSDAEPELILDAINPSVFSAQIECTDFESQKMCVVSISANSQSDTASGTITVKTNNTAPAKKIYLVLDKNNTAVQEIDKESLVSVCPMPADDCVWVRFSNRLGLVSRLVLCNVAGEVVADLSDEASGKSELRISKSALGLATGVYFLECRLGNECVATPVIFF